MGLRDGAPAVRSCGAAWPGPCVVAGGFTVNADSDGALDPTLREAGELAAVDVAAPARRAVDELLA
ncbi:MAG: hypothetical protein WD232_03820, partial [Acidimicrobiales bacterium]